MYRREKPRDMDMVSPPAVNKSRQIVMSPSSEGGNRKERTCNTQIVMSRSEQTEHMDAK
jgi:hypothetical protein